MVASSLSVRTRRSFLLSVGSVGLLLTAGCASRRDGGVKPKPRLAVRQTEALYPSLRNEKFPIDAFANDLIKSKYHRQRVRYKTREKPGTVIVDTRRFYLYHVEKSGFAMRYGVGLGRAGFEWSGRARIAWKRKWPKWTPPEEMIARQPELAKWSAANGGMPPGLDNPLGARALYIFEDGKDTLYRLHGTPEIASIGKAVSSGCVRLVNHDVVHLYDRVRPGSAIVVV